MLIRGPVSGAEPTDSLRGQLLERVLVNEFNFHNHDTWVGPSSSKIDPRRSVCVSGTMYVTMLCQAACLGDLATIRRVVAAGPAHDIGDYDGRTPMHLAASEG